MFVATADFVGILYLYYIKVIITTKDCSIIPKIKDSHRV